MVAIHILFCIISHNHLGGNCVTFNPLFAVFYAAFKKEMFDMQLKQNHKCPHLL